MISTYLIQGFFNIDVIMVLPLSKRFKVQKLDSADSIKRWNNGEIPVTVIHLASAGHGLNLQVGGSTIIWFGLTYSLELYQQINARLWRQGQGSETVVIHHIIAKDTINEDIMRALRRKKQKTISSY